MLDLTKEDKKRIRNGLVSECELLHPGVFAICQVLSSYISEYTEKEAKISHRTIAIQTGYSKRKVAVILETMQKHGFIVNKNAGVHGRVGQYELKFLYANFASEDF